MSKAYTIMKHCDRHPKYKGKKKPQSECSSCLKVYLTLTSPGRALTPKSLVHKDKSKYSRKPKHRAVDQE